MESRPKLGVLRIWTCLVVLVAVLAFSAAPGADVTKRPQSILSGLKVGQSVSLKDEGSAYTITAFEPELPQSHKVMEVGSDYVVVRDIAQVTETTIPIYTVKSIVKVKTKAQ
jgi:hypothetical protein